MGWRLGSSLLMGLATVALAVSPADAKHGGAGIHVKPKSGTPSTAFLVSFRAPDATGAAGALQRRYVISAAQRSTPNGCVSHATVSVPPTAALARVRVKLEPSKFGSSSWCAGRFHGSVEEISGPNCAPSKLCPLFVSLLKTVGKFNFRVRAGHGNPGGQGSNGGDSVPPTFTGLKSAFACTPGPQQPGQTTPYTLTWDAATDNVTPSSKIVYEVYYATASGAEDFATPTWTTAPGVTSFRTPGLPSHGSAYFIVRARDQGGNEEQNRVERRGVDPCV